MIKLGRHFVTTLDPYNVPQRPEKPRVLTNTGSLWVIQAGEFIALT